LVIGHALANAQENTIVLLSLSATKRNAGNLTAITGLKAQKKAMRLIVLSKPAEQKALNYAPMVVY